jgi:RNA-directed DNA polymerase
MGELYAEGLATHGGPESCVDDPRGHGEALTGARAGRVIEPRNQCLRGAGAVQEVEGNIVGGVIREPLAGPARSWEPGHVRNLHAREPGEPVPARLPDQLAGRPGNAKAVILG